VVEKDEKKFQAPMMEESGKVGAPQQKCLRGVYGYDRY